MKGVSKIDEFKASNTLNIKVTRIEYFQTSSKYLKKAIFFDLATLDLLN